MTRGSEHKFKRKPDEPTSLLSKLTYFFTTYKDLLGYIGVGVLVVGVLSGLVVFNKISQEKQASLLLYKGSVNYEKAFAPVASEQENASPQNYTTKAINNFQELIDNYPKTKSCQIGLLLQASTYLNSGKPKKAVETYEKFLETNTNQIMIPFALLGKASAKFSANELQDSLKILNQIDTQYKDFPLMDIVKYEIGKKFETQELWAEAKIKYQEVIDTYPESSWTGMAQKRITQIDQYHQTAASEKEA